MSCWSLLGWVLFGLIIGALARFLVPGRDQMNWMATIGLGVVGSLVGGGIAYLLNLGTRPFEPGGWLLSLLGAIITLVVYNRMSNRKR